MCKIAQNSLSDRGPDAALESTVHGGVNVALESATKSPLKRDIEDAQDVLQDLYKD